MRADARGNVNRDDNKWHRATVRLESGGTSFPRKITPLRSHRGKVNRRDYNITVADVLRMPLVSLTAAQCCCE